MEGIAVIIFLVAAIALAALNAVEIIEYRRYRKAAHSVIALGESMQTSFDQVAMHLNGVGTQTNAISTGVIQMEQDIIFLKTLVQIHGEILKMHGINMTFELNEKLHKVWDTDGEDASREVPSA